MTPIISLAASNQIAALREQTIFPDLTITTRQNFTQFPLMSANCTPKQFPPLSQTLPRFSIFNADSVTLNGFRLFGCGDHLFTDTSLTASDVEAHSTSFNKKLAIGQTENIDFAALNQQDDALRDVARDGAILLPCSDEPSNFGSWIYRFIPKLILSAAHADFAAVMVYQQPWMTDIIRFLGLKCELIGHEPTWQYRVHRPLIPTLPVPEVYFRPQVVDSLERLHEHQDDSLSLGERIYVSRRTQALSKPRFRALENETGLVAALQDLGFVEFTPEKFTFAQQIAIFDKAKIIVGCGGSNMFGCVFARHAQLILDIESGDEWSHAHANLLASTPSRWSIVTGSHVGRGSKPHMNWVVDIEVIAAGLQQLIDDL